MTPQDPLEPRHDHRVKVSRHVQHGWQVEVLSDNDVVRRVTYTDWHRVERAIGRFEPVGDPRDPKDRPIR